MVFRNFLPESESGNPKKICNLNLGKLSERSVRFEGFRSLWQSIRSIWKKLEFSTDRARARTAARLRRAGTDSDQHVRARRVRSDLTDFRAREQRSN